MARRQLLQDAVFSCDAAQLGEGVGGRGSSSGHSYPDANSSPVLIFIIGLSNEDAVMIVGLSVLFRRGSFYG